MGTYDPHKDTRSPEEFYQKHGVWPIAGGAEGDEKIFSQAEADKMVADATSAAGGRTFEGLPQEVRNNPSITRYKSLEELAKGHLELEKKIGLKGVLVPTENSSDEVKANFYKAVGRPDIAEAYENPSFDGLHDGVRSTSEQDLKAFKDKAFELGLSGRQFKEMYTWYLQLQSERLSTWDKLQEEEKNKTATELRRRLGATYDNKLNLVNGLIRKFGKPELVEKLEESGLANNPDLIELLMNVGAQFSEDQLGELGRSGMGMNPEQAKMEIAKIQGNPEDPYHKINDLLHDEAVKKMRSLYQIAYPKPSVQ